MYVSGLGSRMSGGSLKQCSVMKHCCLQDGSQVRHSLAEVYGKLSMFSALVVFTVAYYEVWRIPDSYKFRKEQPVYADATKGAKHLSLLNIGCLWTHFPWVGHLPSYPHLREENLSKFAGSKEDVLQTTISRQDKYIRQHYSLAPLLCLCVTGTRYDDFRGAQRQIMCIFNLILCSPFGVQFAFAFKSLDICEDAPIFTSCNSASSECQPRMQVSPNPDSNKQNVLAVLPEVLFDLIFPDILEEDDIDKFDWKEQLGAPNFLALAGRPWTRPHDSLV